MKKIIRKWFIVTLIATSLFNVTACNFDNENKITYFNWTLISGTKINISALTIDKIGNIYASDIIGKLYQCLSQEHEFKMIKNEMGIILNLITTDNDIIYAKNNEGNVYKITNNGTIFTKISDLVKGTTNLACDKLGNIYISAEDKIYQSNGTNNFLPMKETIKDISILTIDKIGNIYAATKNSEVYKKSNNTDIKSLLGIKGVIRSLTTDQANNVYAGSSNGKVYRCLVNQTIFTEIEETEGEITSLVADNIGNIYAGSSNGTIYKCLARTTVFKPLKYKIGGIITNLIVDHHNNVYAGSSNGKVYIYR